jgi:flagellar protein FlgJ
MQIGSNLNSLASAGRIQSAQMDGMQKQTDILLRRTAALSLKNEGANAPAKAEISAKKDAELKKAASDFESIFINQIFERMRASSPKGGFLDSSREHEIFTSMQDQEVSKALAQRGGIGLSKIIYEQLKKGA